MNLHDLISRDQPFISPCATHFPVSYQVSYGKTPSLAIHWKENNPINAALVQNADGKVYGILINTLSDPVQTLALLDCFQQIVGDEKYPGCSCNCFSRHIFCHARGIYLQIFSMMPLNIQLIPGEYDFETAGFRIQFESLEDFKDFKNLLAGILYWPLTSREYCVG